MNILITFLTHRAVLSKHDTDYNICISEVDRAFNLCDELEQSYGISVVSCTRNATSAEIMFKADNGLKRREIIENVSEAISGIYKTEVAVNSNERAKEFV